MPFTWCMSDLAHLGMYLGVFWDGKPATCSHVHGKRWVRCHFWPCSFSCWSRTLLSSEVRQMGIILQHLQSPIQSYAILLYNPIMIYIYVYIYI